MNTIALLASAACCTLWGLIIAIGLSLAKSASREAPGPQEEELEKEA